MQQQLQAAAAREVEDAVSAQLVPSNQAAYAQQQARVMAGGDMFLPGGAAGGSTGADPRLDHYLMQQRNQQDRFNELAVLEQQRLASLDPELQMRLLRGGSFNGFPEGASSNLLGQQMSFNQRFDPSSNTAASMMSMRGASWMQMQQQMMQQQQQQQQQPMMQQEVQQEQLQQNNDGSSNDSQGASRAIQTAGAGDTTEEGKSVSPAAPGTDPQMFQLYLLQQQQQREQERRSKAPS